MAIELHNFEWEEVRLVQVETQAHHIAGVLANIQDTLDNSDCEWEDIYSAYYDCEDDGTTTFYEAESAEAGNPGIWTYMVYECAAGEEEVVTNLDINTLDPALKVQGIFGEVVTAIAQDEAADPVETLATIAKAHGISIDDWIVAEEES